MNKLYKELNISLALSWIVLIIIFIAIPITLLLTTAIKVNGIQLEIVWWMFPLAIFIWDWSVIIASITLSLMGMMLTKFHNYLTND